MAVRAAIIHHSIAPGSYLLSQAAVQGALRAGAETCQLRSPDTAGPCSPLAVEDARRIRHLSPLCPGDLRELDLALVCAPDRGAARQALTAVAGRELPGLEVTAIWPCGACDELERARTLGRESVIMVARRLARSGDGGAALAALLPGRPGPAPRTDGPCPHIQLDQAGPVSLRERLLARVAELPDVLIGTSLGPVSACAFHLAPGPAGPGRGAFPAGTEFGHLHADRAGSLHLALPAALRRAVFGSGWGEPHPVSGTPLVYGPRDQDELEIAWQLVVASFRAGQLTGR